MLFRSPKRNGNVRMPASLRGGIALNEGFKQTIYVKLSDLGTNTINVNELLSDIPNRTVVITKFVVELKPEVTGTENVPGLFVQLQLGTALSNGPAATQPYKMLSAVNPVVLELDLKRMARIAPGILQPLTTNNNLGCLIINKVPQPASREISARITTFAHVLPDPNLSLVSLVQNPSPVMVSLVTDEDITSLKEP